MVVGLQGKRFTQPVEGPNSAVFAMPTLLTCLPDVMSNGRTPVGLEESDRFRTSRRTTLKIRLVTKEMKEELPNWLVAE